MTFHYCTEALSALAREIIFTIDKPVVFAFHGYPWLIHRLTHRRTNHNNLHVRGYEAINSGNERARLAFDVYVHRLIRELGGVLAVLGGLDALLFTGRVGENCPGLRARVCEQLGFTGLRLDASKKCGSRAGCRRPRARFPLCPLVIRAQEDWEIARECYQPVRASGVPSV